MKTQVPINASNRQLFTFAVMASTLLGPTYNGILAILNARGLHTPSAFAIGAELAILTLCVIGCMAGGPRSRDIGPFALVFCAGTIALFMSMINDRVYPDLFRNYAIVAAFTALGYRAPSDMLIRIFRIVSVLVLIFLIIEMTSLTTYVWIFEPAKYLEASRGIKQFSLNDTGLFANALGFQGRFNFGVFTGPRTSSIFLEQVSLPSYATVLIIYLSAKWYELGRFDRILHASLVLLIILSNNSRTSAALMVLIAAGFYLYPLVNSRLSLLIPMFCVIAAFVIAGPVDNPTGGDDIVGRMSVTVANLRRFGADEYFFGSLGAVSHLFDSGYAYVIASGSIWGLMAFWLYVTLVPGCDSAPQRRAHWSLAFYIYTWLLIGGTAIFTMKTASLLWFLIGHMAYNPGVSDGGPKRFGGLEPPPLRNIR